MQKKTPTFQNFWNAYDLKRDRLRAQRAWNRLPAQDKCKAVARIAAYREDCEKRGINRMYAQGYLNNRRWEDDFAADPVTSNTNEPTDNASCLKMEEW